MRSYRVFNHLSWVPVQWTVLGKRWRLPSRGALIGAVALGVILINVTAWWIGVAATLTLGTLVVWANMHINRLDPDGVFREGTQLSMLWRTMHSPIISNAGILAVDTRPTVTNGKRL